MNEPDDRCQCKGCTKLDGTPCFPRPCEQPMTEEDLLCGRCRGGKCCHLMGGLAAQLRSKATPPMEEARSAFLGESEPHRLAWNFEPPTPEQIQDILDGLRRLP